MSVPPESVPPSSSEPTPPPADMPSPEQRQWAMLAHLSALLGCLLTGHWFGVGVFIGPLVIWLLKKETMPFVDDQAKEALNFNITMAIISVVLLLITLLTLGIGVILTIPAGIVIGIAWLVLVIMATIKSNEGERYRYPFCLRLIK
ncbi:hypothetical protein SAMN05216570_4079 [Dyella sp. OK004]|uniref:DUF4870 domain-containing protein n=1 Tax=Dyella sp. OK004 TaxID=1855292 RepID=UPI0008E210F5|nr:hypothetical protein SAMN05216570_4079 [Dyella sp. OK004]